MVPIISLRYHKLWQSAKTPLLHTTDRLECHCQDTCPVQWCTCEGPLGGVSLYWFPSCITAVLAYKARTVESCLRARCTAVVKG